MPLVAQRTDSMSANNLRSLVVLPFHFLFLTTAGLLAVSAPATADSMGPSVAQVRDLDSRLRGARSTCIGWIHEDPLLKLRRLSMRSLDRGSANAEDFFTDEYAGDFFVSCSIIGHCHGEATPDRGLPVLEVRNQVVAPIRVIVYEGEDGLRRYVEIASPLSDKYEDLIRFLATSSIQDEGDVLRANARGGLISLWCLSWLAKNSGARVATYFDSIMASESSDIPYLIDALFLSGVLDDSKAFARGLEAFFAQADTARSDGVIQRLQEIVDTQRGDGPLFVAAAIFDGERLEQLDLCFAGKSPSLRSRWEVLKRSTVNLPRETLIRATVLYD